MPLCILMTQETIIENGFLIVRPIFVLIVAWIMATSHVIRKHTQTMISLTALPLLPAYHVFYTMLYIAAMIYIYQSAWLRPNADVSALFAFVYDHQTASDFLFRIFVFWFVSTIIAFCSVYVIQQTKSLQPTSISKYRTVVAWYSVIHMGICLLLYWVML